ncbi:tetratricopeptide repeat protein [Chitinimonas viridis]|uniref:Tetratricopeptide repeat protein n=1 Tax=Chitinimonas viridis TaxID=664880 RepID=A0ABT8B148_9NEIS|nr:tetratricopeptide repeat protein [Chitinimonas viridis]MDN3575957.1 tetratricopeptide repeat protein [Chitinimonas viridis]
MSSNQIMLTDATHQEIKRLCALGDELALSGQHEDAVAEYNKAWMLVPDPKNEWETSTWILAAIADSCFFLGKKKSARQALEYAMICPSGLGNPFLHLRLGQILFDQGEVDLAADELMRAYMGAGEKIFENDDPKYLIFLRSRAYI